MSTALYADQISNPHLNCSNRLMVFSGRSNPKLAQKIAAEIGVELSPVVTKTFSNGEVYCRYEESIRGADVFIIQPTCGNEELDLTLNDAISELLVMIDAAVGASARRVIAVTPWFGYARQDKKSLPREPISARLFARLLESAGANRVLAMDLHAGQLQGMFQIPMDHLTALMLLSEYFIDQNLGSNLIVVAPDAGSVKLNKKFASMLGADLAILNKERPRQQVAEISHVIGDVEGKTALIIDDMIDTAGTLKAAGAALVAAGTSRVFAAATHGVFSGPAYENLSSSAFEKIIVTDTIPLRSGAPANVEVLSCAKLIASSILRIFTNDSVSEVFGGANW